MAIADTINSMKTNITNAYNAIQTKGGTVPTNKNLANLSTAINSIITTSKPEQEKMAEATNRRQTILPDNGKTLSKVIIKSAPLPSVNNLIYKNINECLIDNQNKILILGCDDSVIPSDGSVTSIGEWAFYNCIGLTSVTIPDSVTSIGETAFWGCRGLTSITIPDSVTSIGYQAFWGCRGLTSITIPNRVTSISAETFSRCSGLTDVTIGSSVTSIGWEAFLGCSALTSITMLPTNPPTLGSDAIPSNVTTITVPAGCGNTYKTAAGWSAYADKIVEADPGYGPTPTYQGLWNLFGDNNFRGAKNSSNVFDSYGFMSDFISNYEKMSGGATSYWTQFIKDLSAAGDIVKSAVENKGLTAKDFDDIQMMIEKAFKGVDLFVKFVTSSASEVEKSGYMEMKVEFGKNYYNLYLWLKTVPYAPLD